MAYTVPSIAGVPVIRYLSNSTGNEYTAGKTLPAVYRADEMLLCERIDGSGKFGPGYSYSASLGGWIYYGSKYYSDSAILSTLNGKPVTHIYQAYQPGADIVLGSKGAFEYSNINGYLTQFAPTIPATVKYINRMFYGQNQLSGIIKIDANPTSYTDWLTGTTQPIKLTGKSTMLSELAAAYGNVSAYYPHAISVLTQRTNATTQELDDEGTNAKITVTLSGDPDNTTYTIEVRRDGGTVAMLEGVTVSGTAPEIFTVFDDETALATDVSYTYEVVVTDSWGTVRTTTDTLTTAFYTMDIGNQGHEIAFGGSAKEDPENIPRNGKFNCFMDADFKGKVNGKDFNLIGATVAIRGKSGTITLGTATTGTNPLSGGRGEIDTANCSENYTDVFTVSANSDTITVKSTGIYTIDAGFYFSTGFTTNDLMHGKFCVNGSGGAFTEVISRATQAAPYLQISKSITMKLNAGDVVDLRMYNQTGARGVCNINGAQYLHIARVA